MQRLYLGLLVLGLVASNFLRTSEAADPQDSLAQQATQAMRKAAGYYHGQVAVHGGYVYFYSLDLQRRWGEGVATREQVWVQPPGTPTVGMAYLAAYRATGEDFYLQAATDSASALMYGQLESGGWTNSIDFAPDGKGVARYRNGKGRGRNYSTFDDGISPSALQLLMHVDAAHQFKNTEIHAATLAGLDALLAAQFPNGGFPQVWTAPVPSQPVVKASYPTYDWRTENRIKEYWDLYTLNDDTTAYIADALLAAHRIYKDDRCLQALKRLGEFLILAQMPDPQPAWAQQYDYQMRPVWARKFEPPAIAGRESRGAIETLMKITEHTGDVRYLEPIPKALAYLQKSLLKDGRLARYYELKTNTPLYMNQKYELTHDDSDPPQHYGWKTDARLEPIQQRFQMLKAGKPMPPVQVKRARLAEDVRAAVAKLDAQGRWTSQHTGGMLVGQPKFRQGEIYLSSQVFSENLTLLSDYVAATH